MLELPAFDEVNPPVEGASIYFEAGEGDANVKEPAATAAGASTSAPADVSLWQTAIVTLSALLALALLGAAALSLWAFQLRRALRKAPVYPTVKPPAGKWAGAAEASHTTTDVENGMATTAPKGSVAAADAEMASTTTWEPSGRRSHADI